MYVLIFTDKDHYEMSTWHKVRLELSLCLSLVEVNQALIAWLFRHFIMNNGMPKITGMNINIIKHHLQHDMSKTGRGRTDFISIPVT